MLAFEALCKQSRGIGLRNVLVAIKIPSGNIVTMEWSYLRARGKVSLFLLMKWRNELPIVYTRHDFHSQVRKGPSRNWVRLPWPCFHFASTSSQLLQIHIHRRRSSLISHQLSPTRSGTGLSNTSSGNGGSVAR